MNLKEENMPNKKVVIVEGLIGSGKTTLTKELGAALGDSTLVLIEPDEKDGNPYLADFYHDSKRWGLVMQIHLLQARYRMHLHAQWHAMSGHGHSVLDRSYFGDTCFARMLYKAGTITEREFQTYQETYRTMTASVMLPTVCLRILASPEASQKRIQKRMLDQTGRACEDVISLDYLEALDQEIDHMVGVLRQQGVTVLDVPWDVDRDNAADRESAVSGIASRIKGLTPPDPFLDIHRRAVS